MSACRTIYIVDDNAEFRASAQWWLTGAGYAVHDFEDAEAALNRLSELGPQATRDACLLLDVRMPKMSGLDLHDRLLDQGLGSLPVIYMSGHGDVPLAVQAMQKGAVSFLEKPFADAALEGALERAFNRRVAPASSGGEDDSEAAAEYRRRAALLTPREQQVLEGVVNGKMSKVIARELDISTKTVELHRSRVMAKMQAKSVVQLTKMVMSQRVC